MKKEKILLKGWALIDNHNIFLDGKLIASADCGNLRPKLEKMMKLKDDR
jgi:hypothetical protein